MTKEDLEKEIEDKGVEYADSINYSIPKFSDENGYCWSQVELAYEKGALDFAIPREKCIVDLETQLKTVSFKIINCIKSHLCKMDEDYDKPIISPKFLADTLDQMAIDGFEVEIEK